MKKRIAAAFLAGILVLQSTAGIAAEEEAAVTEISAEISGESVQEEDNGQEFSGEEEEAEEILSGLEEETESSQQDEPGTEAWEPDTEGMVLQEDGEEDEFIIDVSDAAVDAVYEAGNIEEASIAGVYENEGILYAETIAWDSKDDIYWASIDWGVVDWSHMASDYMVKIYGYSADRKWSNVNFDKVDWSTIDWSTVDWDELVDWNEDELSAWKKIKWDDVNWDTVDFSKVSWTIMEYLVDEKKWPEENWERLDWSNAAWYVIEEMIEKGTWSNDYWNYVDWGCVDWNIVKNQWDAGNLQVSYTFPKAKNGVITADIYNVGYPYMSPDYPEVENYYMIDGSYLELTINGNVIDSANYILLLRQNQEGYYYLTGIAGGWFDKDESEACGEFFSGDNDLPAISSSDPLNIKYWNIKDYYTLEGLPESVCYYDPVPQLLSGSVVGTNLYPSEAALLNKSETDKIPYLYLKENEQCRKDLPHINSSGNNRALWVGGSCLKTEYSYDDGKTWVTKFSWEAWLKSGRPDEVYVKAAVITVDRYGNTTDKYWSGYEGVPRYLEGELIGSFRVTPYSLAEVNTDQYPQTSPSADGTRYDFVLVNPVRTLDPGYPYEDYPFDVYKTVEKDKPIEDVVYNGKEQCPDFEMGIYDYKISGMTFDQYHPYTVIAPLSKTDPVVREIVYQNNINAGEASVTISFQGEYTGSITRTFTIQPKSLAAASVTAKVMKNPVFTGAAVLPDLEVTDSESGAILKAGTDYEIVTSGAGSRVNAGAASVTVQGKGNYTGSINVNYTILPAPEPEKPEEPEKPAETMTQDQITANSAKINKKMTVSWKGNSIKVIWGKVTKAEGYDIFAQKCGEKFNSKSLVKSVKGANVTSATISKAGGKKVKASSNYKIRVKAYRMVNGKKEYIANSLTFHIAGKSNKNYTNIKKVKVTKTSYTLKKGKTAKISAKLVKQNSSKKLLPTAHTARLRYWSSNKKIATVSSGGKITAKTKGSCYIYVVAADGTYKRVKVTVK